MSSVALLAAWYQTPCAMSYGILAGINTSPTRKRGLDAIATRLRVGLVLSRLVSLPTAFGIAVLVASTLHADESIHMQGRVLKDHCLACHDSNSKEGDLDIESIDWNLADASNHALWVRIHDRVRDGEMPPKDESRIPKSQAKPWLEWLDTKLVEAQVAEHENIGRALARRQNRDEYQNSLRDLLGIDEDYRPMMPEDSSANGFDKVGSALNVSAEHLQAYMSVTNAALREVIVTGPAPEVVNQKYLQRWEEKNFDKQFFRRFGNTFGKRTDSILRFGDFIDKVLGFRYAKAAGFYRFRIHARTWGSEEPVKTRIKAGDPRNAGTSWLVTYTEFPPEGKTVEVTTYLRPGNTLRVSPIGIAGPNVQHRVQYEKGFHANNYQGPGLAMEWVEVQGPILDSWPPSRHRELLGDINIDNATTLEANKILQRFLPRAFRRSVTGDEVEHYVAIYEASAKEASFLEGIQVALQSALCSPHCLYLDAPAGPLDDFALAARLSYFLWSTTPDKELMLHAKNGTLTNPKTLHAQVERMLNDDKATAFNEGFTGQWLDLRKINATSPDENLYPEWDELLEWSSVQETRRFFNEVLMNDLSVSNFVQSDFAILNDRLAEHYGIPGVKGVEFRKVELPTNSVRGGVLSQASVLKVTANGTTSSPVLRGAWVMERILGQPIPPPPQGVPAIEPDIRGATTIREQLDKHRHDSNCAACHAKMDPPGFALESFDVIGGWRDRYRAVSDSAESSILVSRPLTFDTRAFQKNSSKRGPMVAKVGLGANVDSSGEFHDGTAFTDFKEFRQHLLAKPEILARALVEHLVTYATGVKPDYADRRVLDQIVERTEASHFGFKSLIHALIESPIFLNQ